MCVKILSDLMELLFRAEAGQTIDDISLIMKTILRTVIQTIIRLPREDEQAVRIHCPIYSMCAFTEFHFYS